MARFSAPALTALLLATSALCAGCASGGNSRFALAQTAEPPVSDQGASAFGLYLAGEAAIDAGSSRDAAGFFSRAVALDSDAYTVKTRAFTTALVAGEIDRAAEASKVLGDGQEPVQGLGRLTRAAAALADDHGRQALDALSGAPFPSSHAEAAALLKPWAAAAAGDWTLALADPKVGPNPVLTSVAQLGHAELLERDGRLKEAEAAFRINSDPKNGLFVLGLGGFLERRGRPAEAVKVYDAGLKLKPDDIAFALARRRSLAHGAPPTAPTFRQGAAEAILAPAILMLAQHQGDSGLGYLRLSLHLDPSLDEAWVLVGDAMTSVGDLQTADNAYRQVKPGSSQYTIAQSRIALARQQAGDKAGALAIADAALKASPHDARALTLKADLLRDDERFDEAIEALDQAIAEVGPANAGWSLYYLKGACEERAGRWPQAQADLEHALKIKPDEAEVLNYLGYAWTDRGEHLKEATALLERAQTLEPDSGAIIDSLGWARYRAHDYPVAIRDLERAVLLDPSDPEVNNHLGDAYWRVGRRLEARYQWSRVLTLSPDDKMKANAEVKLRDGLAPDALASSAPAGQPSTPRP